jgi:hypothetical protein
MTAQTTMPQVFVGPRYLDDRIIRLVYARTTDEVWTEEWDTGAWVRTRALLREVLKAPRPRPAQLKGRGIPAEDGLLDREARAR